MKSEKAVRLLKKAIKNGSLQYYQATGSYAYVAEYEDGELSIVRDVLISRKERPGMQFEIIAEAKWHKVKEKPYWLIVPYIEKWEKEGEGDYCFHSGPNYDIIIIQTDLNGIPLSGLSKLRE